MIYIYAFICMAFPKAGILVGGLPLNLSTVLLPFILFHYRCYIIELSRKYKIFFNILYVFIFSAIIATLLNINVAPALTLAITLIQVLSPFCIALGYNTNYDKAIKLIAISLCIVGGYALLQYLFGIEETAIYGLNIAYGDSFADKPIGYGFGGRDALKMPSTYQNGNAAGLFYALAIPCVISWKAKDKKNKVIKFISIALGIIGISMSGSRSIIIPFVFITPFIIKNIYDKLIYKKQLLFHMIIIVAVLLCTAYFIFFNIEYLTYMIDRYIITTISDPTGSGRTTLYESYINNLNNMNITELIKSIFIGMSWNKCHWIEGVVYNLQYYGLINFISFNIILLIAVFKLIRKNYLVSLGIICVYVAFVIDASFNFTPGLINYFWIIGFLLKNYCDKQLSEGESICI